MVDSKYVWSWVSGVNRDDGSRVVGQERVIRRKLAGLDPRKFGRFIANIGTMYEMLRDYWSGRYTAVPWAAIAAVIFALVYFLNPADLVPDVIPLAGYLDDASVAGIVMAAIDHHVEEYRRWRGGR